MKKAVLHTDRMNVKRMKFCGVMLESAIGAKREHVDVFFV